MRFLVLALAGVIVFAAPARSGVFNPKSFKLDNGLQVVVIENHVAPIAIQMVWYKVGAADEPAGFTGVAHFLEHLMFKGTKTVPPGEFSKIVARNGGEDNAFTSHDFTAYYQRVAADKLETVMRMEADRMRNLVLTDEVVLPEREVVQEERRSRTDNSPDAQLYEQAHAMLFLNHPYGDPVIGWMHEIEALDKDSALAFYRRYYAPNNAILIVAGDVEAEAVRRLAEQYFGKLPPQDIPPRARPEEPQHYAPARVTLSSPRAREPQWSRQYLAPSYHRGATEHAYALQVLAEILGGGSTSRLYRKLVVDQGVAVSAGAWYGPNAFDLGVFGLSATPRQGTDVATVEAAIAAELERLIKEGVTDEELARAIRSIRAGAIYARDGLRAGPQVVGRALTTGQTIEDVEAWPDRIAEVTKDQVEAAARYVLDERNSVTSILLPKSTS